MTESSGDRFVLRVPGADELRAESVDELQGRIEAGEVPPDAELFDASTGQWSAVADAPVFLFILEELAAEGRLPDALRPLVERASAAEGEAPGDASEPPSPLPEDPFALRLDLVDPEPASPSSGRPVDEPADADAEGDRPADPDPDGPSSAVEGPAPADLAGPVPADLEGSGADEPAAGATDPERPEGFTLDLEADFSPPPDPAPDLSEGGDPSPAAADPSGDRRAADDAWFTPASEGGMVLGAGEDRPGGAVAWEPESPDEGAAAEAPDAGRPPVRWRVAGLLLLAGAVAVAGVLLVSSGDSGEPFVFDPLPEVARPQIPPPPPDLTDESQAVVAEIERAFRAAAQAERDRIGIGDAPPESWLSGVYLASAGDFPEVVAFWEGYLELLEAMHDADASVYRGAVEAAVTRAGAGEAASERLRNYFAERYRRQVDFRDRRFADLAEAARAAVHLHDLLIEHEAAIEYAPALGRGVSADPILEAVIPEGPVRQSVEGALDRVFDALDRTRGGGPPSADGLRTELFGSFGDPF